MSFTVNNEYIGMILQDYNITAVIKKVTELQRYHYENYDPDSKEVRLILKVDFENAKPLVIRFKNEKNVTLNLIESQCQFAEVLQKNGIDTPTQYQSNGSFAKYYHISGYDVIVTIEQFVENEITIVDTNIAEKTGELLAKTHTISEQNNLHVDNEVLFDPFATNDLIAYDDFASIGSSLDGELKSLFDKITDRYNTYMTALSPLKEYQRYAVQGDISQCNLYLAPSGNIGIFDFNRCGDNILFCDAVMQAIFEARLMDYPENRSDSFESEILTSFWRGYCSIRSISKDELQFYPYLYTVINAFWSQDICWREDSLINAYKAGNMNDVRKWLSIIWDRLTINPEAYFTAI